MKFLLALLLTATWLHGSAQADPAPRDAARLWLVSNGFHTGLVLSRRDAGPELRRLAGAGRAGWLLVAWGHAGYYRASRHTFCMALSAALLPSASALHLVPLSAPPAMRFAHSDVIEFTLTPAQVGGARRFVEQALARDPAGRPVPLGPGFMAGSRFYAGRARFHFPRMCTTWTAAGLRHAGIHVGNLSSIAASELTWQAARSGRRVAGKHAPLDRF